MILRNRREGWQELSCTSEKNMYNGLNKNEVDERIQQGKVNVKSERMTKSYKEIVKSNIVTYFNIVNAILFVIVLITGELSNTLFMATIVFNAIIGIVQEIKSKQLLDKMAIMVATKVDVKRDDEWKELPVEDIVLDDLIRVEAGQQIPVDGEVLEGYLEVNESMLTGESNTVIKEQGAAIYSGTIVTSGQGQAKATKVGHDCAASQIMKEAQKEKRAHSKLHDDLEKLIRVISFVIIPAGITLYLVQYFGIGMTWRNSILKTVAAVVGMIPEGLVVLTSVALAVSTIRLSQRQVLVQDLFSIESLARVDTICLDKTGTLTKGTMEVSDAIPLLGTDEKRLNEIMGSYLKSDEKPNATSAAMIDYFNVNDLYSKTDELPFSSDRKYAGASLKGQGSFYVGAVSFLFPKGCPAANKFIRRLAAEGKRVVIIAHTEETSVSGEGLPDDLEPCAVIALKDVLRDNVQDIMKYFEKQDVEAKVISGDDPATVSALALQAGIPHADNYVDMSQTSLSFEELVKKYTVFGRVLPDQKKNLVKALQKQGHTVAMTGDGVNDVPALKTADVSVAMAAGSPAAKDSANIVLLTNDFGLMPDVVNEGRRVINNISRASSMYLVKTTFSILLSLYVIVMVKEYPFLPVHLSLISAFGVGLPTFLLQLEPSFERVQGKFFPNALRRAVPSGIAVFIMAMLCILIRDIFAIPDTRFYGIFLAITAYIYLYTLLRVYYPPTVLRRAVVGLMGVFILTALIFFQDFLSVSFIRMDLLVLLPSVMIVPALVNLLCNIYDGIMRLFSRIGKKDHETGTVTD